MCQDLYLNGETAGKTQLHAGSSGLRVLKVQLLSCLSNTNQTKTKLTSAVTMGEPVWLNQLSETC